MQSSRRIVATTMPLFMLIVAWGSLNVASAQDNLSFDPYTVYVVHEEAFTRCGPSADYYRTDELRHGQELEVYAETEDGWLGIRPPETSFCWIPAETVEIEKSGDRGVITEDRTVAWIGTHLGRARKYRWQVQLATGEPVTVIGQSEREGPDGPQLWYRIVPPSGEFRWVHRDQIVDSTEALVASTHPTENSEIEFLPDGPTQARAGTRPSYSQANDQTQGSPSRQRHSAAGLATTAQSGSSVLADQAANGTGSKESWQTNQTRTAVDDSNLVQSQGQPGSPAGAVQTMTESIKENGLLASVAFLGRPRMLQIGASSAPSGTETAGDDNWISGIGRRVSAGINQSVASNLPITPGNFDTSLSNGAVQQVAGVHPMPAQTLAPTTVSPNQRPLNFVSAARIAQIQAEAQGADIEGLSLILSRLMAAQASAAETDPLASAARQLAATSSDPVIAGRARLLAERADQYGRVATRRDGEAVIRANDPPAIPSNGLPASAIYNTSMTTPATVSADTSTVFTGHLVQVYSARPNSPPFALTDNTGRTIAYVTPTPGVNLRTHLNSKVTVSGTQGFVTGLNMPHLLASQAIRTAE